MPADTSDEADDRSRRKELLRRASRASAGLADRAGRAGRAAARWFGSTSAGKRLRQELTDWPETLDAQLDVTGDTAVASDAVPQSGEVVFYIHGFLGEGRLESVPLSGAHQGAALQAALEEVYEGRPDDPPPVVAVVWGSSTEWFRAQRRTETAGETFARWLDEHRDRYDSVTIVGHSLGGRVALWTLAALEDATVDEVALLGAAVAPDAVCKQFREPIETRVTGTVCNYHSENDRAVCSLYRITERAPGIGCHGSDCGREPFDSDRRPANYVDVDVSDRVPGHRDYYQPRGAEYGRGTCVDLLVERQFAADHRP